MVLLIINSIDAFFHKQIFAPKAQKFSLGMVRIGEKKGLEYSWVGPELVIMLTVSASNF